MNKNPYKARQARKKKAKAGTVNDLTLLLWRAVERLEEAVEDIKPDEELALYGRKYGADDLATLCRLTHAMSQAASTYLKALEVGEFEARLAALEAAQAAEQPNTLRRVA